MYNSQISAVKNFSPKHGKEILSEQPKMHIIIIIIHTNRPKVGKNCLCPVCRGCCREGSIIKKFYMDGGSILRAYEHKTPCSVLIPIRGAVIKSPKFDSNSNGHSWGLLLRIFLFIADFQTFALS